MYKIFIPIFVICVLVILIIVGLHFNGTLLRQRSMLNNNDNININLNNVQENFQTSSRDEVKMGASTFYDWGITKNKKDKDSNNKPSKLVQSFKTTMTNFRIPVLPLRVIASMHLQPSISTESLA